MSPENAFNAQDIISDSAALLELSNVLNASTDLDFILGNVLLSSMGKLMVTRGAVLVETEERRYRVRSVKGIPAERLRDEFFIPLGWEHFVTTAALMESPEGTIRAFAACARGCELEIVIPMLLDERMVGIIVLGRKLTGKPFVSSDLTFLESVAAVAASAVRNALSIEQLRGVNRRLDTKIQEMNTLFEISREMNTTFIPDDILRILGYALMGQLRVLRFVVFTHDGTRLRPVLVKNPDFVEDDALTDRLQTLRETLVFSERHPAELPHEQWLQAAGLHTIIPMLTQNQLRGMLCLGPRVGGLSFDRSELEYLHALANITISALENARLVKETIEKQKMEQELSVAKSIQKGLLPKSIPAPDGYRIAAVNESSQLVGGDYYDVIPLSAHEFILAIADVSGKGVPASLLMANVQAALRIIAPLRLPLSEATAGINALIHSNTSPDKFITFFWGLLDTHAHTFTYVNAGHNPPYLLHSDGRVTALNEGGLILGILAHTPPYAVGTIHLAAGETLVCYTDGVNEAMSRDQEEFTDERLQQLLIAQRHLPVDDLLRRIRDEIVDFTRGAPQSDDITMLLFQRLPP